MPTEWPYFFNSMTVCGHATETTTRISICDNVWRAGLLWKLSDNSHSTEKGHNFDTRGKDKKNKTVQ